MKKLLLTSAVFAATVLTGCAGGGYYASARIGPPPPPRYGVVGYAPGPGYVWTDGWWDLRGNRWIWAPGRWQRPPRPGMRWYPHEWRQDHGRYRMRRGGWRM
jgi:WXXGXW repeat (2 copies)